MNASSPRLNDGGAQDAALVERGAAGDQHALTALYNRHAAHVAGVVYRVLGKDGDLDDIVQETFVEGLRQLRSLREPSKIRSFLVTIAVRRIHARLSFRYRMRALASELFGQSPQVSDPAIAEDVRALYAVLQRVAPRHRIVWVLHRVEGYTLPEVAEQSSASLATVKRWISEVDERVEADDAR
jgi:RNA polymerase sigma-70 factor (ECF subfamily)